MSKKTRKKSSKGSSTSSGPKAAKAKAARGGASDSAKTPVAKARKAATKKAVKTTKTAVVKASHKPTSKPLKSKPSAPSKPITKPVAKPAPKPDSGPLTAAVAVEGSKAPGFRLPRDGGDSVSLADFAGQKLVLFFYPRADTPGCTREAMDFTRLRGAFADSGAAVLGVSADTVTAQESFRDKHQLTVPLVSDEKHEMLEAYGAWGEKSMYGRTFLGILRTTVLIGSNGKIAKIWRNVRVDGHADEVLAAVQAL